MKDVLRQEFEMFDFFERTPVLVCIAGKDGYFRKVNPAVIEKFGYSEEELYSRPISTFIHKDDMGQTSEERARLLDGHALMNFQNRYVSRSGEVIWLEWTSVYFSDKEVVFAIASDITAKKIAEKEIQEKYMLFKGLADHFKSSIEEDRKFLAIELHEELAQLASVVKMDLEYIRLHTPAPKKEAGARLEHALGISSLLINTIRRISFSISPQMLEDHGLGETLEWHCGEFSKLNGIPCKFNGDYDEGALSYEVQLDFFRICQEALTNIMYHADATRVDVGISDNANGIRLSIRDNGKGFAQHKIKNNAGITSMQERVTSINGKLTIDSEPGKGTLITVVVSK